MLKFLRVLALALCLAPALCLPSAVPSFASYVPNNIGTVNVVDYGADPTGAADSTAAASTAAATGKVVYYPTGNYKVSSKVTIPAGGIIGDGYGLTIITSTDTSTADAFSCSGIGSYVFKDFLLLGPRSGGLPVKTAGAGIDITPAVVNNNSVISNVSINGFPTSALLGNTTGFVISGSFFEGWTNAGVSVNDTTNADGGDSVITGSTFATSATTGVGVAQQGSGGLKIVGSKFNGGAYGYQLNNIQGNTGDLIIESNSIENMTTAGISLGRSSGSFTFFNVNIVGNQISNVNAGVSVDPSGAITDIVIADNVIQATAGTNQAAIGIFSGSNIIISGNRLSAQPIGTNGILIGSPVTNTKIGKNFYTSVQNTISNNATSPTVTIEQDTQTGSTNVTTGSVYGSLFAGSVSVTFPTPFSIAPTVSANVTTIGGGGGVSCIVTTPTKTGFIMSATGVSNGGSVPCSYVAQGVI